MPGFGHNRGRARTHVASVARGLSVIGVMGPVVVHVSFGVVRSHCRAVVGDCGGLWMDDWRWLKMASRRDKACVAPRRAL